MSKVKSMRIDNVSYDIGADYSNIDNTPTFKTINGEAITGTGNITIEGGSGTPTDVKINGSSITSSGTANIVTEGVYNPSTNKLATMDDIPASSESQFYVVYTSDSSATKLEKINNYIQDLKKGISSALIYTPTTNIGAVQFVYDGDYTFSSSTITLFGQKLSTSSTNTNYGLTYKVPYAAVMNLTLTNGEVTNFSLFSKAPGYTLSENNKILGMANTTAYTPTGDYNPSTKLYTDKTHYENMAGYDATKTQVLKNINGTLTWVDE